MVSDVERELVAREFGFAPVPAAKSTLLLFQVDAVPDFEAFGDTLIVLNLSVDGA